MQLHVEGGVWNATACGGWSLECNCMWRVESGMQLHVEGGVWNATACGGWSLECNCMSQRFFSLFLILMCRNNDELVKFLQDYYGKNFVKTHGGDLNK